MYYFYTLQIRLDNLKIKSNGTNLFIIKIHIGL
jgi:hypothetical protein